jgi:hypothetical protein
MLEKAHGCDMTIDHFLEWSKLLDNCPRRRQRGRGGKVLRSGDSRAEGRGGTVPRCPRPRCASRPGGGQPYREGRAQTTAFYDGLPAGEGLGGDDRRACRPRRPPQGERGSEQTGCARTRLARRGRTSGIAPFKGKWPTAEPQKATYFRTLSTWPGPIGSLMFSAPWRA